MTIKHLSDIIIYLGALAAAVAAIGVLLTRLVVRPMKRWVGEQIEPQIAAIRAEVTHNSGHSLKDAVRRIEVTVDRLDTRLDDHIRNH